jgi:uncharacterized protein (TIGR02466 family)
MMQPIFMMGVGVTEGQSYLDFARSLFDTFSKSFGTREAMPTFKTTLVDYCINETNQDNIESAIFGTDFENFIVKSCADYLSQQGFNTQDYVFEVDKVWLNEMESGSSQPMHSHNGHHVSGCFYVDMPENSSSIGFEGFLPRFDRKHLKDSTWTHFNSSTWTLEPSEGQFICWNSYMRHYVPEKEFKGIRRSIAFDVSATKKVS